MKVLRGSAAGTAVVIGGAVAGAVVAIKSGRGCGCGCGCGC